MTLVPTQPIARFNLAIERFDAENSRDPNLEIVDGTPVPRELLYARRLSEWVLKLAPEASEVLLLAARCQHICRWTMPRSSQPMTRPGYLRWRADLKKFHAAKAGEILLEVGYEEETIQKVQNLNLKKNFPHDPESCVLEDALCLVFLQFQFVDLVKRTAEDKVINAVQKSWSKMTPVAHELALKLPFGEKELELIQRALHFTS